MMTMCELGSNCGNFKNRGTDARRRHILAKVLDLEGKEDTK